MREPLRVLDLFSGIGGFSLGLERTGGFQAVAFCELEPFASRVLAQTWPGVPNLGDVRHASFPDADVITAGFPCQDISRAGDRAGLAGQHSGLWREVVRAIRLVRPVYVILENVAALLGRGLDTVLADLAEVGHDAEWDCLPAAAIGARHIRDRAWLVAYPARERDRVSQVTLCAGWHQLEHSAQWSAEPGVCRVADGLPDQTHRLAALGNAVVPQIPELIGRAILASLAEREAA